MKAKKGIIFAAPQVSIVGVAAPTLIHQLSPGRTAIIREVLAFNGQVADILLEIGTGATLALFARRLPRLRVISGFQGGLDRNECPHYEFEADIYALPSAAGAGALAVDVELEVEEIG